jgi:glutathione S-transferase
MSSQIQPITVWGQGGPNPPKVAMILEELGLPYEVIPIPLSDVKKPDYVAINPNGRIPAIHDPNTDITLWESGAIVEYLIERYDTEHRLSFAPGTPESYHAKQWLYFQVSGQGPYYGQAAWFKKYHPEQVPSAKERYNKEVNRVSGVLDSYLAQQKLKHSDSVSSDGPWLVGNKMSYADIAFVSYQKIISMVLGKDEYNEDSFPVLKEWLDRMTSREAVKTVLERAVAAASHATK